jgi:hypothetical protein
VAGYRLTIRDGARVERRRFDRVEDALAGLEARGRELQEDAGARPLNAITRRYEPVQQVIGRLELSGPGRLRAGIDVRGDGSAEGWTGRVRRRLIEQRERETPYEALRRTVGKRG